MIEIWKAAIAFLGVVIAAIIPPIIAYRIAGRRNATNANLEEIRDRAAFRAAQLKAVKGAQDTAAAALDQVDRLIKRIGDMVAERDLLFESNTRLRGEREILATERDYLRAKLQNCEKELRNLKPKLIEGDIT